jgi:hypothetical protein
MNVEVKDLNITVENKGQTGKEIEPEQKTLYGMEFAIFIDIM